MTGALARQNAMRNPRRTAGTASALMVGVGVVTLFTVFAASLQASIDDTIDRSFGGDLVVDHRGVRRRGHQPAADRRDRRTCPRSARPWGWARASPASTAAPRSCRSPTRPRSAQVLDLDVTDGLAGRRRRRRGRGVRRHRRVPRLGGRRRGAVHVRRRRDRGPDDRRHLRRRRPRRRLPGAPLGLGAARGAGHRRLRVRDRGRRDVGGRRQGGGHRGGRRATGPPTSRTARSSRPR